MFRVHVENNTFAKRSCGLSRHRAEKLLVQLDTEPQQVNYTPDKVILNRFDVFTRINAVPPDTLLGQKLLCILNRKRALGRDFFDAIFLMGKTKVNMAYLNQKLGVSSRKELLKRLRERCAVLNFEQLATDVAPLVYRGNDIERVRAFMQYVEEGLS